MGTVRRTAASFLCLLWLAAQLAAQPSEGGPLTVYAFTLKNRQATEAVNLVYRLLSPRGSVELQPGTNTLVVRDTMAAISRIVPVLRNYDHPARPLMLELYIVRASRAAVSPPVARSDLPEELTRKLRELFRYDNYAVQARAQLHPLEGQAVTYVVGGEYEVRFRAGTILQGKNGELQVRLSDFAISRQTERKGSFYLQHTNVYVTLEQTKIITLAKDESSPDALMVVLIMRAAEAARRTP